MHAQSGFSKRVRRKKQAGYEDYVLELGTVLDANYLVYLRNVRHHMNNTNHIRAKFGR